LHADYRISKRTTFFAAASIVTNLFSHCTVLPGSLVERPGRAAELAEPIGRRPTIRGGISLDIPISPWARTGRPTVEKPRVLIGGMIGDKVQNQLQVALVHLDDQHLEVAQRAENRIDVRVVLDVITEVGHGRGVERRKPDGPDSQPLQIVEPGQGDDTGKQNHPRNIGAAPVNPDSGHVTRDAQLLSRSAAPYPGRMRPELKCR